MTHKALRMESQSGVPILGSWLSTDSETAIELFARGGVDFVIVECQHSIINDAQAAALVRRLPLSLSCAVMVRVSVNDGTLIGRVADAGADGIVVPMVETAAQAHAAVAACRYPPEGVRSFGPFKPGLSWDLDEVAHRVSVFPMIETSLGLENAGEICATPGVSGVIVGPADLSISLGLDPREAFASDQLHEPLERIAKECRDVGIFAGIHVMEASHAGRLVDLGFNLLTIGNDALLFLGAVQHAISEARASVEAGVSVVASER